MIRELILEKVSPVLAEDIKWHQNLLLRFKATCIESQVNRLQKLGTFRQRWLSNI